MTTIQSEYQSFLTVMEAIEEGKYFSGRVVASFDEDGQPVSPGVVISHRELKLMAQEHRKLQKERDELQEKLDATRRRLEDLIEEVL